MTKLASLVSFFSMMAVEGIAVFGDGVQQLLQTIPPVSLALWIWNVAEEYAFEPVDALFEKTGVIDPSALPKSAGGVYAFLYVVGGDLAVYIGKALNFLTRLSTYDLNRSYAPSSKIS